MQRKSMAVKDKNENSPAGIDWNVEAEVHLFSAMNGHKPVGVNKHFHMACIFEKFCTAINKNISPQVIWKHLQTMYDMQALDDSEVLPFPNDEKDFSLPDTLDFANMMHEKGKLCETKEDVSKAKEVKEASRKESKESPRKDDKKESPKKELKESPPKKELKESKDPSKKDSKDIAIVKKDVKETPKKESKDKESGKKEIRDSKEVSTGSRGGVSTSSRREVKDTGKDTNKREHRDSVSKKDAKERESRRDSKGESKSRESRDLSTKRDTRDSLRKDSTGSQKDNDSRKEIVVKKESKDSKDMKKDTKDMKRETRKDFKDARDLKSASVVSSKTKGRDSKKEEEKEEFSIRRSQPLAEDKRGSKRSTRGSIVNDGGSKCASPVTVLSSASSRSGTPQPTAKRRRL